MLKNMHELIKNIKKGTHFALEGEVFLKLFDRYVGFVTEDDASTEYVVRCAEYFNSMSDELVNDLCLACIRYCNSFLEMVGEKPRTFESPRAVLEAVSPSLLIVPSVEDLDEPVIHMELNCDWEVEHGMEWVVRRNHVLYVGSFNGEDPWADYLEKESWNYA
jgi:hypothetical protein